MALSTPTALATNTAASFGTTGSIVTGSVSPASDCLLIVAVNGFAGPSFTVSSISTTLANVGTWTIVQSLAFNNSAYAISALAYARVSGAPGSGTITATFSTNLYSACIAASYVTGHNTTTPVGVTATGSALNSTDLTLTLSGSPSGMVFATFGRVGFLNASSTMAPDTGFTELQQTWVWNSAGASCEIETQYDLAGADSTVFMAAQASSDLLGTAIEIVEAASTTGTVARTEGNDTLAAAGTTRTSGTVARTEASDTLAATGGGVVAGTLARTEGNDTVAASGATLTAGTVARTEGNDTSAAAGTVIDPDVPVLEDIADSGIETSNPYTIPQAAGVTSGDTIVVYTALATSGSSMSVTSNDGLAQVGSTNNRQVTGYYIHDALFHSNGVDQSAVTDYDLTASVSFLEAGGYAIRVSNTGGVDTAAGMDTTSTTVAANCVAPDVVTTHDDALAFMAITCDPGEANTPAGWTLVNSAIVGTRLFTKVIPTAGSTGTPTITSTAGNASFVISAWAMHSANVVSVAGTVARTEGNDSLVATGTSTTTGTVARTEGNDTLAAAGTTRTSGVVARTEAGDTLSATGSTLNAGALARTEGNDTLAAAGTSTTAGTVARTEGNDSLSAAGAGVSVTGTLAVTEGNDSLAAAGTTTFTGTLARTEAGDTLASSGTVTIVGAISSTEAADVLAAVGEGAAFSGTVAVIESSDSLVAVGTTRIDGTLTRTEAGDTAAVTATLTFAGTLTRTESNDTLNATGRVGPVVVGTASFGPAHLSRRHGTGRLAARHDAKELTR